MVFRLTPDNSAIWEAVKSTEKSFTSHRIFASEILERMRICFGAALGSVEVMTLCNFIDKYVTEKGGLASPPFLGF